MTFSVAIGTFGGDVWRDLAKRAACSAHAQTVQPLEVIHVHGPTLEDARNSAAAEARGEWMIFLDADDALDERYVEHMTKAVAVFPAGGDLLLQPSTLGVYLDGREDPQPVLIPPKKSILDGNHLVIGTAVRREQFLRIGGFSPLPIYEDWQLWVRAILDGARPTPVPGAVYRVTVRPDSRNNQAVSIQRDTYHRVRDEFLPLARAKGLA